MAYSEDGVHYRKTVPDGFDSIAQWFTDHHFQGLPMLFPDDNLEYNEADYGVTAEGQRLKVDDAIAPDLVNNFPSGIIATAEETEELALYQTDLDTYIKDSIARWICGQQDIDATWDEYLAPVSYTPLPVCTLYICTVRGGNADRQSTENSGT